MKKNISKWQQSCLWNKRRPHLKVRSTGLSCLWNKRRPHLKVRSTGFNIHNLQTFIYIPLPSLVLRFLSQPDSLLSLLVRVLALLTGGPPGERRGGRGGLAAWRVGGASWRVGVASWRSWRPRAWRGFQGAAREKERVTCERNHKMLIYNSN